MAGGGMRAEGNGSKKQQKMESNASKAAAPLKLGNPENGRVARGAKIWDRKNNK